jgi:hypothetical protein
MKSADLLHLHRGGNETTLCGIPLQRASSSLRLLYWETSQREGVCATCARIGHDMRQVPL